MLLQATIQGVAADGRAPVLLLHGLFGSARNWGAHQKALAAEGRQVIALDLRNHGESPHGPVPDYATLAADVAETLGHLGHARCRLLGHSMGGKVAMALALTRPALVERIVIADIAPRTYPNGNARLIAAMRGLALPPGMTRAEASAALAQTIPDATIRAFLLLNLRLGGGEAGWRLGLAELAAGIGTIEGWQPLPGVFTGPALSIAGGRSAYVPEEARAELRALFPAIRFATLPAAGHWLHADDPQGFLAAIRPFLDEAAA
ncbi:alpha/beta fold hydrolase [Acidisoma sp. C75]